MSRTEPTSTVAAVPHTSEVLRQFVVDKGLDIGFAYDGDADRCIAVDHRGNIIDGDKIMYVCGKYLREKGQLNGNTVVTTVMSNLGLYKSLEREGIDYEQTAVGDKYVCREHDGKQLQYRW